MSNRIIKESVTSSDTINGLSDAEESTFYRLLTVCDDYGRFDARPEILAGRLYPLRLHEVTPDVIKNRFKKLQEVGLLFIYEVNGREYLQITKWAKHQSIRAKASKYPNPPEVVETQLKAVASNCEQMKADESNCSLERERERERDSLTGTGTGTGTVENLDKPIPTGRPFVQKFLESVWKPNFPNRSLIPVTYTPPLDKMDRLEKSLALFADTPDGLTLIFDYLNHEIGPAGEATITAFRTKVMSESARVNSRWEPGIMAYFASTIERAHKRLVESGSLSGKKATPQQERADDECDIGADFMSIQNYVAPTPAVSSLTARPGQKIPGASHE